MAKRDIPNLTIDRRRATDFIDYFRYTSFFNSFSDKTDDLSETVFISVGQRLTR